MSNSLEAALGVTISRRVCGVGKRNWLAAVHPNLIGLKPRKL